MFIFTNNDSNYNNEYLSIQILKKKLLFFITQTKIY